MLTCTRSIDQTQEEGRCAVHIVTNPRTKGIEYAFSRDAVCMNIRPSHSGLYREVTGEGAVLHPDTPSAKMSNSSTLLVVL
jgi:hypothetical protein